MLDVRVKMGVELSTDHHLLVCSLIASGKAAGAYTNVQDQEILPSKVESPGGQRRKKDLPKSVTVDAEDLADGND